MWYKSMVVIYHSDARCFSGLAKFTIASTALGNGEMPSKQTWGPKKPNSVVPNLHFSGHCHNIIVIVIVLNNYITTLATLILFLEYIEVKFRFFRQV